MKKQKAHQKSKQEVGQPKKDQPSGPPFAIRMGIPTMDQLWSDLTSKAKSNTLSREEERLYKKWGKALAFLKNDPFYSSLNSHEISTLTQKYGKKIFESYLENNTPGAARMFWVYGPERAEITILALEPHPEPGAYGRVKLDTEPSDKAGSEKKPEEKKLKTKLWFIVENNTKYVRGKSRAKEDIEQFVLSHYGAKPIDDEGREYEIIFSYTSSEDLDKTIYDMIGELHFQADLRNCFVDASVTTEDGDRSW